MKTKLRAFTMIEITVAMILSGICIAIAFNVFQMSSNFFNNQREDSAYVSELQAFMYVFQRDVSKNVKAAVSDSRILIETKDKLLVEYRVDAEYIIRTEVARVDTFHLSASNLHYQPLMLGSTVSSLPGSILLEVMCEKRLVPLTFHIHYDAAFLLENANTEIL